MSYAIPFPGSGGVLYEASNWADVEEFLVQRMSSTPGVCVCVSGVCVSVCACVSVPYRRVLS